MNKLSKIFPILLVIGLAFGIVACSDATNDSNNETTVSTYSNEYLEIVVKKMTARSSYYSSSEIASFTLAVKFNDSSVEDLTVNLTPTDTYSFNIFKDCSVTLEVTGYNSTSKKIAYGTKKFNFTVGTDVAVIVPIDMLVKSSTVTVGFEINENKTLSEQFLSAYGSGTFYKYWFSDLSLTSLQDYLEKGTDLAYFEENSGTKLMIDRPYGNETVVVLDSTGKFWVFNTKNEDCTVKIKINAVDSELTQGIYSYETLYIYDSNGWAHNTWSVSEFSE